MANAWMIKPQPNAGAVIGFGTLQRGAPANVFNDYAGVIWQAACDNGDSASLRFDLGDDTSIDTVMIFGVELLPPSATVSLVYANSSEGYFTGPTHTVGPVPAYAGTVPVGGKGVTILSIPSVVGARYLQLNFLPGHSGEAVRIARVVVGHRIQLERNFSFGAGFGVKDLGSADFTRRGVLARVLGKILRTVSLTFSSMRKYEVEGITKPLLEQIGNTRMVAVVTDPAADAQLQNRCYYGLLVGDLGHAWRTAAAWEAKINVVSIF